MAPRTEVEERKLKSGPQSARGGKLGLGQAPPVGLENAKMARCNIERKLGVFRVWIKHLASGAKNGEPLTPPLGALPRSQRAFNAWSSEGFSNESVLRYGSFWKNSNATLRKNGDLLAELLESLRVIAAGASLEHDVRKQKTVASLRRRLAMATTIRKIAERELVKARVELHNSHAEVQRLTAVLKSTEAKAMEDCEELHDQLKQIAAERASLAALLSKVTSFRRAR